MDLTKLLRQFEKALRKAGNANRVIIMGEARRGRNEARKLAKEGFNVDMSKVSKLLTDPTKMKDIFEHGDIIKEVRKLATKTITTRTKDKKQFDVRADKYIEAEQNLKNWNKSVEMWNKYHAEEIKKDPSKRRYKKTWLPFTAKDTEEQVDNWFDNIVEHYKSAQQHRDYMQDLYIRSFEKAIFNNPHADIPEDVARAFLQMLSKHLPKNMSDYDYELDAVYYNEKQHTINQLQRISLKFGFQQEFNNWLEDNNYSRFVASLGADSY